MIRVSYRRRLKTAFREYVTVNLDENTIFSKFHSFWMQEIGTVLATGHIHQKCSSFVPTETTQTQIVDRQKFIRIFARTDFLIIVIVYSDAVDKSL